MFVLRCNGKLLTRGKCSFKKRVRGIHVRKVSPNSIYYRKIDKKVTAADRKSCIEYKLMRLGIPEYQINDWKRYDQSYQVSSSVVSVQSLSD